MRGEYEIWEYSTISKEAIGKRGRKGEVKERIHGRHAGMERVFFLTANKG